MAERCLFKIQIQSRPPFGIKLLVVPCCFPDGTQAWPLWPPLTLTLCNPCPASSITLIFMIFSESLYHLELFSSLLASSFAHNVLSCLKGPSFCPSSSIQLEGHSLGSLGPHCIRQPYIRTPGLPFLGATWQRPLSLLRHLLPCTCTPCLDYSIRAGAIDLLPR